MLYYNPMKKSQEKNIIKELEHDVQMEFRRERKVLSEHFPLGFALAGAFGASMLFAGVSGIIQAIPALKDNPVFMMIAGAIILMATGTLYKRLG